MPESFLIVTPLLVLAVILLLGFAGCKFEPQPAEPTPTPPAALTFGARVPSGLTVLDPGVKFAWTRPGAMTEETMTVPPTAFTFDEPDNVYEQPIPSPEAGSWLGRCEMTVQEEDQTDAGNSGDNPFTPPAEVKSVVLFQAEGSPAGDSFKVVFKGLIPE
jgi:hypothetical protein